ncbi:hypothetical protein [Motilimonas sp. KMU-193]|uniref:hypothetical protein n=1 Tax=Motilimonas sp. KMU-193 TaxID=3388668 RepID=UPI00396B43AF
MIKRNLLVLISTLSASVALSGCNSTSPDSTSLVYISDGYVQCEQPPAPLVDTAALLQQANVTVLKSDCGQIKDMGVISMCGAGGTGIHLHQINSKDLNQANQAGFDSIDKLTEQGLAYEIIECGL